MRTLEINKRKFYYCLYTGKTRKYDEYGNRTSEQYATYAAPVECWANISPATGQSMTEQFGGLEDYDKVIVTHDTTLPIDENTVLYVDKVPGENEAYDYIVKRVARSINSLSIAISKVKVK